MESTDRTVEMRVPVAEPGAAGPGTPPPQVMPGAGRPPAGPSYPGADQVVSRIPQGMKNKRPSPALDPLARARISRTAKWIMLIGILLLALWIPATLYNPSQQSDRTPFFLASVTAATIFAAVFATGLPRLLVPGLFGRWHEAVEALRDWLIVGIITGVLYWVFVNVAKSVGFNPPDARDLTMGWVQYRLPLLLVAGIIGVVASRVLAIRQEGVLSGRSVGQVIGQVLLQVVLLGAFERPFEKGITKLATEPALSTLLGYGALLCAVGAFSIIMWAASADASLSTVRRRRGASGFNDGTGPVNLTLTVIGGRESGKTVLLAAAFYEWSTQNLGHLRITPAAERKAEQTRTDGSGRGIGNLEDVARELYINNQFPVGTVSTQNLPFDLSMGQEKIARFTFLDYPGGAIAGRVADNSIVQEFWDRVEDTDGILLIADMSYVRRAVKDADWLEVRNAYRTVMQRLVDRNGKRRVVPVALVLTKCDEFVNPETGQIDMAALKAGLKEFQYDELEAEWRDLNAKAGPGFAEFSTWITSAITYSQPQLSADGRPDYSKPFQIAPPPPTIAPTGCASPLLWITSKVMRWNVTAFYDISTFLFGSSPRIRRRVEAVLETERIAEERAGKA